MPITRWDPMRDVVTLRDAMDRLFEESVVAGPSGNGDRVGFTPPADAWEDEDAVTVELAVPGADPEAVEITYEKGALTVMGEIPARDPGRAWVLQERARGKFARRFNLNLEIDVDKASARVENGVLILQLPKREEVKPRKIAVKAG